MSGYDFVVVGGGVIGLAVAWRLAQCGQAVAVLEADLPGGASQAAAGMLAPLAEARTNTPFVQLGLESLALYPAFLEELTEASGTPIAPAGPGMLRVAYTPAEANTLRDALTWQRALGLPLEWLDPDTVREREPNLSRAIVGAVYSPKEQHVTPRALREALRLACTNADVQFQGGVLLKNMTIAGQRVTHIPTDLGLVQCDRLVLATGAWTGVPDSPLTLALPIAPLRGQALSLQAPMPLPFSHTLYASQGYLVPRDSGQIVVGATEENAGFHAVTTPDGIAGLRAMASLLVPQTAALPVTEHWAGLRPVTPDGLPLLGKLDPWDNVYLAAGHGRNGILLTPYTADALVGLMLDNIPLPDAVSPARFGNTR